MAVSKKFDLQAIPFLLLFLLFLSCNAFADETRGLRIVAKDKETGEQKEVELYKKSYAVIIGIDQYPNLPFDSQLTYAVRDAKGVEQVLRKNFKFDKVYALYNKDATREKIVDLLLGELSGTVTENDSVFVFWAGHGFTEKTAFGDLGYLLPYDGTFKSNELHRNISMNMLKDDISKKIPAKHVFYVMDACYSGLLAATRGANDRKTARDLSYLQEVTKEKVRQVLTAGDAGQEVLDGGPMGHSVFTGRLIELFENTEDFITATEVSTMIKEKVFSDARGRNHTQTPRYGELFGVGDFVFVPSIERKVEDTQSKVAALQKEFERLEATEKEALKAQDERAKRQAEFERRAVEAKLKAEQLKQQALEEERRKKELAEATRLRRAADLAQKKKAEEERVALLKQDVELKRKTLGGATLAAISPAATIEEMRKVDAKIKEIKESFRAELASGILQISERLNERFVAMLAATRSEFESETEFADRMALERADAEAEQTGEFTALQKRIESEYSSQTTPFIEQLKSLSGNEFTITAEDLILELGTYHAASDTYPVTIKSRRPINGIQLAASANIPIPREEAREFKLHFENNMLRPEVYGNFQSLEFFRVAQAYVIDDATNKKYDLFASKFVDLGNGVVYDEVTKMLWPKDPNLFKKEFYWSDAQKACENLIIADLSGWRLPNRNELERMFTVYHNQEPHPFNFGQTRMFWTSEIHIGATYYYHVHFPKKEIGSTRKDYSTLDVWCVRGK